jgi:predicted RNase H-like nuclease (RuvC/YqgF family)
MVDINGGPKNGFTWTNLISLGLLVAVLISGGWILFQSQFSSLERSIAEAKVSADKASQLSRDLNAKDIATAIKQSDEHEAQILAIQGELERRRDQFITQYEFKQFEQRYDDLKKRTEILEATRPTADTLQQAVGSLEKRIESLYQLYLELQRRTNPSPVKLSEPR